ncbi:MAG: hypothetical protein IT462_11460 [Planctomycetes bacterium]|nr:hypothetical protein [Planctomycetota bacterium]
MRSWLIIGIIFAGVISGCTGVQFNSGMPTYEEPDTLKRRVLLEASLSEVNAEAYLGLIVRAPKGQAIPKRITEADILQLPLTGRVVRNVEVVNHAEGAVTRNMTVDSSLVFLNSNYKSTYNAKLKACDVLQAYIDTQDESTRTKIVAFATARKDDTTWDYYWISKIAILAVYKNKETSRGANGSVAYQAFSIGSTYFDVSADAAIERYLAIGVLPVKSFLSDGSAQSSDILEEQGFKACEGQSVTAGDTLTKRLLIYERLGKDQLERLQKWFYLGGDGEVSASQSPDEIFAKIRGEAGVVELGLTAADIVYGK